MAPKFSTPRVWKRPYTSIYNDNYRYGNSLYAEAITDIERKYNEALARTTFRHDRPDLNLSTFSDSQLSGESIVQRQRAAAASQAATDSVLDSIRLRSLSSSRATNYTSDTNYRLQKSESFDTYQSQRALANVHSDLEESKLRRTRSVRTRRRPESTYGISAFEEALLSPSSEGPSQTFWQERCRELHAGIENVMSQLSEQEDRIKHESTVIKNKLNQDIADLMMAIDDQDRQISDLHKILKKQGKNISDLSLELEASQRHYLDSHEQLMQTQKRCSNLCHEVDEMRSSMDKVRF